MTRPVHYYVGSLHDPHGLRVTAACGVVEVQSGGEYTVMVSNTTCAACLLSAVVEAEQARVVRNALRVRRVPRDRDVQGCTSETPPCGDATMTFEQVLPALRGGSRIRRVSWPVGAVYNPPGLAPFNPRGAFYPFGDLRRSDILADDWEVVPEAKPT